MVVKFGMQQERGAAGESNTQVGKNRNFANLYNMNRADDQVQQKANGFRAQADAAGQDMSDAISAIKRPGGNTQQAQGSMANAVARAKGISNQAQNFSPAVDMMKNGNSAYQSGVGSFYAGGNNSTGANAIRKFSGLYQSTLDRQAGAMNDLNKALPDSTIQRTHQDPRTKADRDQAAMDQKNDANRSVYTQGRGQSRNMRDMSNLDWMLKTGRITTEQYYAAQNDDATYDALSKQFN